MSKALQIKVPQPCHENWLNMTPKEQGRFCGSCEKIVVDFSKMSDKEMLNYFTKTAGQSTCGRFANDQLNRKVEAETNGKRFSLVYAWKMLLASVLFFQSCRTRTTTGIISVEVRPSIETIEDQKKDSVAVDKDTTRPKGGDKAHLKELKFEEAYIMGEIAAEDVSGNKKDCKNENQ